MAVSALPLFDFRRLLWSERIEAYNGDVAGERSREPLTYHGFSNRYWIKRKTITPWNGSGAKYGEEPAPRAHYRNGKPCLDLGTPRLHRMLNCAALLAICAFHSGHLRLIQTVALMHGHNNLLC